jgi:hypothetical protein
VIYFTLLLSFVCFRNVSLGVNTAWTRIGGMLSPQIFLLVSFLAFCVQALKYLLQGRLTKCPVTLHEFGSDICPMTFSSVLTRK